MVKIFVWPKNTIVNVGGFQIDFWVSNWLKLVSSWNWDFQTISFFHSTVHRKHNTLSSHINIWTITRLNFCNDFSKVGGTSFWLTLYDIFSKSSKFEQFNTIEKSLEVSNIMNVWPNSVHYNAQTVNGSGFSRVVIGLY